MTPPAVIHLDRPECLELLQFHAFVGRVGFIADSLPHIIPVNYLADGAGLVFCSAAGGKLSALAQGASVVFEVDDSRALDHSGWSVVVRGTAREITDPDELEFLRRGPLRPWGVAPSEHWIRVGIEDISGVRVTAR